MKEVLAESGFRLKVVVVVVVVGFDDVDVVAEVVVADVFVVTVAPFPTEAIFQKEPKSRLKSVRELLLFFLVVSA